MSLRLMSVPVLCKHQRRKDMVVKNAEMFGNISSIDAAIRRRINTPKGHVVRPYRVAVRYGANSEGEVCIIDVAVHFERHSESLWNCFFRDAGELSGIRNICKDRAWLHDRNRFHYAVLEALKDFFSRLESDVVIDRLTRLGPKAIEQIEEGSLHEEDGDTASLLRQGE